MNDIKSKVQGVDPNVQARNVTALAAATGNIYESLVVIARRSRELNNQIRHELEDKLNDFAVSSETIEEIHENKEQIEISKFYERLPNPAIIATNEFIRNEIQWEYRGENNEEV
ncbi:MAG: DNA-directed RNA polymerase subunit omega [Saprospiraceae bacterium]